MNCRKGLFLLCLTSKTLHNLQQASEDPPNVSIIGNVDLGFKGNLSLSTKNSHNKSIMCVFDSRAIEREEHGKFGIEDVDPTLCTHLILRYMEIKYDSYKRRFELQYVNGGLSEELIRQAVNLKGDNTNLKVILSVGGSPGPFRSVSSYNYDVRNFADNVVKLLKDKNLDGLNVEWMWPEVNKWGEQSVDWFRVTNLISALSNAMKDKHLELGLVLPSDTTQIKRSFNIAALEMNVDYFILMGQDFAGHWGHFAGHNSPLISLTGESVQNTVTKFLFDTKISPHKVILRIPFAGRVSKLRNPQAGGSGLGAPTEQWWDGQGTFQRKFLNYNQICSYLLRPSSVWTAYADEVAKVPFMKDGEGNWVSFENTTSVQAKVEFGEEHRLGGYAAWSITNDDFEGDFCGGRITYPLLRTINYVLIKKLKSEKVVNSNVTIPPASSRSPTPAMTTTTPTTTTTTPTTTTTTTKRPTDPKVKATLSLTVSTPSSVSTQQPTSSSTQHAIHNISFESFDIKTQFTSPELRNENKGRTEISGADGGSSVVIYVVVTLLGMIFLLVVVFFLVRRKRSGNKNELSNAEISRFKNGRTSGGVKYKRNTQAIVLEQLQAENKINCSPYDDSLEIPHTEYEIFADEILGSGAYGVVLRGKVRNESVAVKTVKPLSSKDQLLSLMEEIKVMTYLGKHEHILSLIGANTALLHRGIVYVFVELCPLGTLKKYLNANKSSFVDLMKNDEFTCEKSKVEEDGKEISSATLLIWAHQISNAMQFLESKKVIHGDLGTRNVRVCSKYLVKISDFGSSRKMYACCNCIRNNQVSIQDVNNSEEPLPWRHMSLETLTNHEFSTKSDLWAFGVTLWEIFSLGALPYPGMSYTFGFTDDLMGGRRMSKPRHATTELYEKTMLPTWKANPQDRPSFEELCSFLHDAVERVSFQQEYVKVNIHTPTVLACKV